MKGSRAEALLGGLAASENRNLKIPNQSTQKTLNREDR